MKREIFIETIVAIATAPGKAGIGIIRLSGPISWDIAAKICKKTPKERYASFANFYNAQNAIIDSGLILLFKSPHSFTGEDVAELQAHGGPLVLDMLLKQALQYGARLASPGEFSYRAFINDKIDLAQAEAIADLIDASSMQAVFAAQRSLQGDFSAEINGLCEQLISLRMYVEAAIDFPEEEIDFLADQQVTLQLQAILSRLDSVLASSRQGQLLRDGLTVVLTGLPNVGKSSLLNSLSGTDTAIVTEIPGTTRDVLHVDILIDGLPIHIVDTAGLRTANDIVEQEGIKRAWQQIQTADLILLVVDATRGLDLEDQKILERIPKDAKVALLYNKVDLLQNAVLTPIKIPGDCSPTITTTIALSAKTAHGIDELKSYLKQSAGYRDCAETVFLARRRHLHAIESAQKHVLHGQQQLLQSQAGELLAEDLRQAQLQLSEITGEFNADDLLGRIFSSFCVGK